MKNAIDLALENQSVAPAPSDEGSAVVDAAGAAAERLDGPLLTLDKRKYRETEVLSASRYFFCPEETKPPLFRKKLFLQDLTKMQQPFCPPLQNVISYKKAVVLPAKKHYN